MDYRFVMHKRASKQLHKLPSELDERIQNKLQEMITNEFRDLMEYDVDTVSGVTYDIYRTRIGGHRVFFVIEGPIVAILHVDDREGAYGNPSMLDDRADDFF